MIKTATINNIQDNNQNYSDNELLWSAQQKPDTSSVYAQSYYGMPDQFGSSTAIPQSWSIYASYTPAVMQEVTLSGNPYLYTGQAYEFETGLYYYHARFYSPYIGRFLQTDPAGYDAGMNLYAYCLNNSLNRTDPSGCMWVYCNQDSPEFYEFIARRGIDEGTKGFSDIIDYLMKGCTIVLFDSPDDFKDSNFPKDANYYYYCYFDQDWNFTLTHYLDSSEWQNYLYMAVLKAYERNWIDNWDTGYWKNYDVSLLDNRILYDYGKWQNNFVYVSPLKIFAKGSEVSYTGWGVLWARMCMTENFAFGFMTGWKVINMVKEWWEWKFAPMTPRVYTWPNSMERYFCDYGYKWGCNYLNPVGTAINMFLF